jgi:DNA polymerase-3 subunit epsilon
MRILGIDFETTWTQPVNVNIANITEIGAALMEWESKSILRAMMKFINDPDIPASPAELIELTGITDEMRLEHGVDKKKALQELCGLIEMADFCVAHNGNSFDKPILVKELERVGLTLPSTPWIDTKIDVPYSKKIKSTKLSNLATEHKFLNPFAHRALFDVLTMLKVLEHYDINEVIALSKEDTVTLVASVSYQNKEQAKERGYYWNAEEKIWCKDMKISKAEAEKLAAPFPTMIRRISNEA